MILFKQLGAHRVLTYNTVTILCSLKKTETVLYKNKMLKKLHTSI